ncbi:MAG: hypothetical protein KDA44_13745 [Planctomycetales bacterium]|nr:hypothetical protein [Planctomycetales bacterium]
MTQAPAPAPNSSPRAVPVPPGDTYEDRLSADVNWALHEGSMHFEGDSAVHRTLRNMARRLSEMGVDYAIAGGMALFFHGYRRFTEDVDVLVTPAGLARIHAELEGRGYVRPFETSKNLRDAETRVRIDFLVAGQFPGDGKPGPVAFPEPAALSTVNTDDGIAFLPLATLVQLKLASGRTTARLRDLADVQELIRILDLPLDFATNLDPALRDLYQQMWREVDSGRGELD